MSVEGDEEAKQRRIDEARKEMRIRAQMRQCVFCGEGLPERTRDALGRICPSCLPVDSDRSLEMMKRLDFSRPKPPHVGGPQNSYWIIDRAFGPFGLIFPKGTVR